MLLCAFVAVLPCVSSISALQLMQQLFYNLIEVMKLWKLGDRALLPQLCMHVRSTYTCFVTASRLLGQSEIWAKLHDLLHIPTDLYWSGSADGGDTGARSVGACALHVHAWLVCAGMLQEQESCCTKLHGCYGCERRNDLIRYAATYCAHMPG